MTQKKEYIDKSIFQSQNKMYIKHKAGVFQRRRKIHRKTIKQIQKSPQIHIRVHHPQIRTLGSLLSDQGRTQTDKAKFLKV